MKKILKREIICTKCEGIGFIKDVENYDFHTLKCSICNGEGYIVDEVDMETGYTIDYLGN